MYKKYNVIFNEFKKIGLFHYLTGIMLQIAILLSFYNILSLSTQTIMPIFMCKNPDNLETHKCTLEEICNKSIIKQIDLDESVWNWTMKFELYCGREYFIKVLTSSLFISSIFSMLVISVLSDRFGRLYAFRLLLTFTLIGYLMVFSEYNLVVIYIGVVTCYLFNQLYAISIVYLNEFFPQNIYSYLVLSQNIVGGCFGILVNLFADYFRQVRGLLTILLILNLLAILFSFFMMTESPDWLIKKYENDHEYLDKQLLKNYKYISKINRYGEEDLENFENLLT